MTRRSGSPLREHHPFKFCGANIPSRVINMMKDGKISNKQFSLWVMILAYSGDDGGSCFASNEYLAQSIGVKPHGISKMVSKLNDLKLINIRWKGHKRHLTVNLAAVPAGDTAAVPAGDTIINTIQSNRSRLPKRKDDRREKMCFIRELVPVKSRHKKMAHQLYLAVKKKYHVKRESPPNFEKWAREFIDLEKERSSQEIQTVLDWYCSNTKEKDSPKVYCALSFRKRFRFLEAVMNKNKSVEISEEAQKIADRIKNWGWNKGKSTLPQAVQLSLNRYREFREKANHIKLDDRVSRFRSFLLTKLPTYSGFVSHWFEMAKNRLDDWDKWDGNLVPFAFKVDSEHFQRMGKEIAEEYSGPKMWKEFMEAYNASR